MISVLYTRTDSVYKELGVDCWDINRDARTWPGGNPVVAHPPCRAWGKLRHFANPRPDERQLAINAINKIRLYGGVLEHPSGSQLWKEMELPTPGTIDKYGGFSLCVDQSWWGHKAQKRTLLYICGCAINDIPPMPICFEAIQYTISTPKRRKSGNRSKTKLEIPKKEREATPVAFAKWLIALAEKCNRS